MHASFPWDQLFFFRCSGRRWVITGLWQQANQQMTDKEILGAGVREAVWLATAAVGIILDLASEVLLGRAALCGSP